MKKIILLASLAFSINAFAQVPSYVPTNGLVGWWPLDSNANDMSSNVNNGTPYNMAWGIDRFGNSNSVADFNGVTTRRVEVLNPIGVVSNKKTFSSWIKLPTTYSNGNYYNHIITASNSITNGGMWCQIFGPYPTYISAGYTNKLGFSGRNPTSQMLMNTNDWHHIVYIANGDSSKVKLYIDGIYQGTDTISVGIIYNNWNKLDFGQANSNFSQCSFSGQIDDIGIWDRELSNIEISNLYSANICYQNVTVTDTLVINTGITGFNPIIYKNTIKVYPNPTNDHITIDNGNISNLTGYQIKITNSLSQQVFQSTITQQQFYVDLSTWTGNGIYFVHIIDAQGNTIDIKKIVLQ
jgi:hypothetical protein